MNISLEKNESYWNKFYENLLLSVPSQFCAMVSVELPSRSTVVELGCGNGRDSLYFASQGYRVAAIDLSKQAIAGCSESAVKQNMQHAKFQVGSLADRDDLKKLFETARNISDDGSVYGYSRFVMHSINDEQQDLFLQHLSSVMNSGEKVFFEFRSLEDAKLDKTFGDHYRRFVDTNGFVQALTNFGFDVDYRITGQGMARYKNEDPFVSRLIAKKK